MTIVENNVLSIGPIKFGSKLKVIFLSNTEFATIVSKGIHRKMRANNDQDSLSRYYYFLSNFALKCSFNLSFPLSSQLTHFWKTFWITFSLHEEDHCFVTFFKFSAYFLVLNCCTHYSPNEWEKMKKKELETLDFWNFRWSILNYFNFGSRLMDRVEMLIQKMRWKTE